MQGQPIITMSHPTGNTFARALVYGLDGAGLLESFHTTLSFRESQWLVRHAGPSLQAELLRRSYAVPAGRTVTYPFREIVRLLCHRLGLGFAIRPESSWASIDSVFQDVDRRVAAYVRARAAARHIRAVYCYEDAAYRTFLAAGELGLRRIYDLPIAYWQTSRKLLSEEAERLPDWAATLGGTDDSPAKLERKTGELELADMVVCPSQFVLSTLPQSIRATRKCIVAEFGTPEPTPRRAQPASTRGPLRLLFAGQMTQRKGLADLFSAMKLAGRPDVELVVMGAPVLPLDFYFKQYPAFKHEPPRPHRDVLALMATCDVLVLPSIVEGRALVQQEAMSCGLPIIVTANAGGQDLVEEGLSGFIVPIRSPEAIAAKIAWFADNRHMLAEMSARAIEIATGVTWDAYCQKIIGAIQDLLSREGEDR